MSDIILLWIIMPKNILFLFFQQPNILISCRSAQIANPRKLRQIHLASLKRWIMTQERSWYIISGHLRSADFAPFCSGVCHSRTHAVADNTQFKLREYSADLSFRRDASRKEGAAAVFTCGRKTAERNLAAFYRAKNDRRRTKTDF